MLNYSVQGDGETIVFLHGFCSDLRIWEDFVAPFKEEYRVILLDLPGCGKSLQMESSLHEWAKACWETLSELGIQHCHVVGHSMGGYVALEMLALAPERMHSFTSFHSSPLADNAERRKNRHKQINFIETHGPKMLVRQIVPALFHADAQENALTTALTIAEEQNAKGLQAALASMANRADNRNILYATTMPVLFVSGRHDAILPFEEQQEFVLSCNNAQIMALEQSAHMGMLEETQTAQSHLANFLASTA